MRPLKPHNFRDLLLIDVVHISYVPVPARAESVWSSSGVPTSGQRTRFLHRFFSTGGQRGLTIPQLRSHRGISPMPSDPAFSTLIERVRAGDGVAATELVRQFEP